MKTLRALLWGSLLGALIGYLFAPRHADLLRAELMEHQGQQPGTAAGGTGRTGTTSATGAMSGISGMMGSNTGATASSAQPGSIIGNTHTKVYHQSGDADLPEEENRAYFATPEEAEAAGYHAAGRV